MPNGNSQDNSSETTENKAPRLLVPAPMILRALASYLEITGEAEKFAEHLVAVIQETGLDAEVFDGGERGPSIG